MKRFKAEYKPKESAPDKPILVGRDQSQARISINEAMHLIDELMTAVRIAKLTELPQGLNNEKISSDI